MKFFFIFTAFIYVNALTNNKGFEKKDKWSMDIVCIKYYVQCVQTKRTYKINVRTVLNVRRDSPVIFASPISSKRMLAISFKWDIKGMSIVGYKVHDSAKEEENEKKRLTKKKIGKE